MEKEEEINLHVYYPPYNRTTLYLLPSILLSLEEHILKKVGFINCFLEHDFDVSKYENCIVLVFQPSKSVFEGDIWESFNNVVKNRKNLINIVEYDGFNRIFGFWFKIDERFGRKLIFNFKNGYYSNFPDNYCPFLHVKRKMVVTKDPKYITELANRLGIKEEILEGMELDDVPKEHDYLFNINEIKRKCKLQTQED